MRLTKQELLAFKVKFHNAQKCQHFSLSFRTVLCELHIILKPKNDAKKKIQLLKIIIAYFIYSLFSELWIHQ